MNRELVILSDNFGTSFSGGCTATANFVRYWIDSFSTIHVVCKKTDGHLKDRIEVWKYSDQNSLNNVLSGLALRPVTGYGDFHTAVQFIKHDIPFFFTYHDNYPEMKDLDYPSLKTDNIMDDYIKVFTNSKFVFSASEYKLELINMYTSNCIVVRNGISQPVTKTKRLDIDIDTSINILMAGNITERKYKYAIELFGLISENKKINIRVDIFGECQDSIILGKLKKYDFVKVNAFSDMISYAGYHVYLNTSIMENLSLAVVDSLKNYTPVLTFDVGGLNEVVNEGNGILISPYDVQEMFSALDKIRNSISQYRFDQSKLEEFNWEKSAQLMLNIMITN